MRLVPVFVGLFWCLACLGVVHAIHGQWSLGFGQGTFEAYYGGLGDHTIIVSCSPDETMSLSVGLVAPASEARRRQGVMIFQIGERTLRLADSIGSGRIRVAIPGTAFVNGNGETLVSTREDPTRMAHTLDLDDDRRSEIDAFVDLLLSQPGAPMTVRIAGEPRVYRISPNRRVRTARDIREVCPLRPRVS